MKPLAEIKLLSWELPDPLWNVLKTLIEPKKSKMGRPIEVDFHNILEGIFYVLRTGIQWQACPREEFGPPSTVYHYFNRWSHEGVFKQMWVKALVFYDCIKGLDFEWQSVDAAMTKAPLGGEATGANPTDRGKLGTKRSVLTEGHGIPIAIVVDGANRHDMKLLAATLNATVTELPNPSEKEPQHLCLDKGYDYDECRQETLKHGYTPHIRSRGEEKKAKIENPDYKPRRWVVEVTHSWINRFRKILVRFEKKLECHQGLLQLACTYIVFKRSETF